MGPLQRATTPVLVALLAGPALTQPLPVEAPDKPPHNQQRFGPSVRTPAPVQGDFSAMGARVVVDQPVSGDALLAGGTVDVRAPVGDDLRAAGGDVVLESRVGGNLSAAGGQLTLTEAAQVLGSAELAGGEVQVSGRVDGALDVRAQRLVINAAVGGDVRATVQQLELGPLARIGGGLRHNAASFTRDPAAVVSGPLDSAERAEEREARGRDDQHPMHGGAWPGMGGWWLLLPVSMGLVGLLSLAALVLLVFSGFAQRATRQIEAAPWLTLGVGSALLLALPVLAVLLVFTLLGIPLGLVVMVLYPPLLLLGWLIGALYLARQIASRWAPQEPFSGLAQFGWTGLSVLLLLLAGAIPLVGPLVVFVTVVAGLGACVLEWRRRAGAPPTVVAT